MGKSTSEPTCLGEARQLACSVGDTLKIKELVLLLKLQPAVNSRPGCSRLTLQTQDLHAQKADYRRIWGDSVGTSSVGSNLVFGRLLIYTTASGPSTHQE